MTDWLKLAKDAYTSSTSYIDDNHRSRWEDAIRMFHSQHPKNSKYNHPTYKFRSRIFRPKSRSVVRKHEATAAMAFFSNLDVVSVAPVDGNDAKQIASAIINKELVQYRLSKTIPWFQTLIGAFQDTMKTGLCVSFQYWKYKSRTVEEERIGYDPETLEETTVKVPMEDIYEDEPCIELHPIENLRFSPYANWADPVKTSPFLILITPMFVYKVRELVQETDKGMKWKKITDDQIKAVMGKDMDTTDAARRGQKGGINEASDAPLSDYDTVPVHLNFMDSEDGKMVYYTLKDEYLMSEPIPMSEMFWHGQIPIVVGKCIIDTHNPVPDSLIDLGAPLQRETNEVANQRLDNVKLVLNKRWLVRRNSNVDVESLNRNVPGGATMVSNTAADGGDVREVNWQDVTSSSYQEQDRINVDYDDLTGGGLNAGSVMTNRKLNETVGGMKIMAQGANNLTEYTIRTFVETWVEPVLRQLMLLEQYYESDETIRALAGRRANLYQKFGSDQVTDDLLINELTVNVNVGMGATDPDARFQHFMQAMGAFIQMAQTLPPDANIEEIKSELFGLAGYRDGSRFFSGKVDPRMQKLQEQMQQMGEMLKSMQAQLEFGLKAEQEKRSIDAKRAQVEVKEIAVDAKERLAQHTISLDKASNQHEIALDRASLKHEGALQKAIAQHGANGADNKAAIERAQAEEKMRLEREKQAEELRLEAERQEEELRLAREKADAEIEIARAKAAAQSAKSESAPAKPKSNGKEQPEIVERFAEAVEELSERQEELSKAADEVKEARKFVTLLEGVLAGFEKARDDAIVDVERVKGPDGKMSKIRRTHANGKVSEVRVR